MTHPFAYAELHCEDPAATADFYRELFDWKATTTETPVGPYVGLDTGAGMGGGLRAATGRPPRWVLYVQVTDLGAATDRAVSLGARAVVTGKEVPGAGTYSLLDDPSGATFGLWQPAAVAG